MKFLSSDSGPDDSVNLFETEAKPMADALKFSCPEERIPEMVYWPDESVVV
jgi:hypothetical protein